MGKVIILNLLDGSFNQGFHVTCEIAQEGETHFAYAEGKLPRDPEIPQLYQRWQSLYRGLIAGGEPFRRVTGVSATNISVPEIQLANQQLELKMRQWLDNPKMRFIVEQIYQHLNDDHEEIRVVFRTRNLELQRLPWHCWKIFDRYPHAEAVLSLPVRKPQKSPPADRVKILVVLGDSSTYGETTQIGIDRDLAALQTLPNAEIIALKQPSLERLDAALWSHSPEILFFAGHSASEMDGRRGSIYLNSQEFITIGVLKPAIRNAVSRGLQLAIFNSCDGLGIVQELSELHIPQVIVMREPVPDLVAQNFLSHFITAFSQGKSLCLAVKQARERIHRWEHYYPGVTLLPMIFQNPAERPYTWRQIQGLPTIVGAEPPPTEVYSPEIRLPDPETVISPPTTQVIENQSPQEASPSVPPTLRYCQNCRSAVLQTDLFCSNCGFKLNQTIEPQCINPCRNPDCEHFNKSLPKTAKACPFCGEALKDTSFPSEVALPFSSPIKLEQEPVSAQPAYATPPTIDPPALSLPQTPSGEQSGEHPSTAPAIGQTLAGRYRLIANLGGGGFGKTYLASDIHRPGEPKCVVKRLEPMQTRPSELEAARRLFMTEAETLERLGHHDQIPRLLAYFTERDEFYLVMEYVDGHPLEQEIQSEQPWSETQVRQLLQEVLAILEFVHGNGVIHRDIKPANLIRRSYDRKLVLVDFGAVKQVSNAMTNLTIGIGTPGYLPSEQRAGHPRLNSDIYALGMIAIQTLTGSYPGQIQSDPETLEPLWENDARASADLKNIIGRMVRYNFRERYQTVGEVLQDLAKLPPVVRNGE